MTKWAVTVLLLVMVAVLVPGVAAASDRCIDPSLPIEEKSVPSDNDVITLNGTVRDFKADHPDFNEVPDGWFHVQKGLVENTLDGDGKPVFTGQTGGAITSQDSFRQWYRDVTNVNSSMAYSVTFTETSPHSGIYEFHPGTDGSFFPVDDFTSSVGYEQHEGWDGELHNFLFTMELHGTITYNQAANQTLQFCSDDDLWVFVDGNLVVDLGGVHPFWKPEDTQRVNLDHLAASLGLVDGQTYSLDIFFAERHTVHSQFEAFVPATPMPEMTTIVLFGVGLVVLGGFIWRSRRHGPKQVMA
ncbi:fibro-slime domain-containing protein [Chloroflexota bacterium]